MTKELNEWRRITGIGCGQFYKTVDKDPILVIHQKSCTEKSLEKNEVYCQRCFRYVTTMKFKMSIIKPMTTSWNCLNETRTKDALIINVIDIFDSNGTAHDSRIAPFVGDNPFLLVGHKVDLLPKILKTR